MSFDIEPVSQEMVRAITGSVKDDVGDIKNYADTIVNNEKQSLKELAEARVAGEISDEVFNRNIAREKKVVKTELLTIQLMTEAAAQKAVNAAINVFVDAVKAVI